MNKTQEISEVIKKHHVSTITEKDSFIHLCEGCEYVEYSDKKDAKKFNDKKYEHVAEQIANIIS